MQDDFIKVANRPPPEEMGDWRKYITITSDDPVLKRRIEKTLDYIQNSPQKFRFPSDDDPNYTFTGKDMLRAVALYVDQYRTSPDMSSYRRFLKDDKLEITAHNRKFDMITASTGSYTMQMGPADFPVAIGIGRDYLKTMEIKSADGKFHPVTLEGVIFNELVHASFRTENEEASNILENQLLKQLKYPERSLEMKADVFRLNPKTDYVSLLDPQPAIPAAAPRP